MSARWPDCRYRYHADTVPMKQTDARRRERERMGRHIAWFCIGFLVLVLSPHIPGIPGLFR